MKTSRCLLVLCLLSFGALANAEPLQLSPGTAALHALQWHEFSLVGVPETKNPFDPDEISVDVTFSAPDGTRRTLPAFWMQDFTRRLSPEKKEELSTTGNAHWCVRWTPMNSGTYRWKAAVTQKGKLATTSEGAFKVAAKLAEARGFAHIEPAGKRTFQTSDGQPLILLGENLCWPGARGTFDYDDWLPAMHAAGMNYQRLWQCPWAFNAEFFPNERLNYNQQRLWGLDYVLEQSERDGIFTMLCLDYHGALQTQKDMWGGNDRWRENAYNVANGGPCASPNEFFTNTEAEKLYRKRLRYLIARYSCFPHLLSWEFWNEINNDYSLLKPTDVVSWHDRQARWLKANDPYQHLITTSLGSAGDQKELWQLHSLDYVNYHWYGNWGGPFHEATTMASTVATDFHTRYGKPVVISEFGTHGGGDKENREYDPLKRGLQQALWAGIFSGSGGTSAPWWWEQNHAENNYPLWASLHRFLEGTDFASKNWKPIEAFGPKRENTNRLGEVIANATPFEAQIPTSGGWGDKSPTLQAINSPLDADGIIVNPFLHGNSKPDMKASILLEAYFAAAAKLVVHINSVSNEAILAVKANGNEIFRRELPNKDGKWEVNHEYDEDIEIPLPSGPVKLEIWNPGGDWINMDSLRFTGLLPAKLPGQKHPPLKTWAQSDGKSALVWVLDPRFEWPHGRTAQANELKQGLITLRGLGDGTYRVQWWNTTSGQPVGETRARSMKGEMQLGVIPFKVDVAARLQRA